MNHFSIATGVAGAGRLSAVCLLGMGQTTLLICLPLLVAETGIGYGTFAALVALGTALFLVAAPLWGRMSDVVGRRPVVLVGILGFLFSHALMVAVFYGLTQQLIQDSTAVGLLVVARLIYGLTVAGLYPAVQAWVLDETAQENRSRALSRITAAISLGRLTGPLLPLLLISSGVLQTFVALIGLSLIPLFLLVFGQGREPVVSAPATSDTLAFRSLSQAVWPMLLLACWVTTAFGQLQYLIGPLVQVRLQFSPQQATELLAELMVMAAISTLLTHLLIIRWVSRRQLLSMRAGSTLLLSGCMVLIMAENIPAYIAGVAIAAASVTLLTPAYMGAAAQEAGSRQGTLTGTFSAIHTLGYSLGAVLAGLSLVRGVDLSLLMTGLIALMAFITTFFLLGGSGKSLVGPEQMQ